MTQAVSSKHEFCAYSGPYPLPRLPPCHYICSSLTPPPPLPTAVTLLFVQFVLLNRLLRLVSMAASVTTFTRNDLQHYFIPAISSSHHSPGIWLALLRPLFCLPLFFLNHAYFVLPFAFVLPAQLLTLASMYYTMRITTCMIVDRPGSLQLSQRLCQLAKVVVHYLVFLGHSPKDATQSAAAECQGMDGIVLLMLFTNLLLQLLLPCIVVYLLELDMKMGFIRQQRLVLSHACPCHESGLTKGVVIYGALVGGWLACEVAVMFLSPLECDAHGLLVKA